MAIARLSVKVGSAGKASPHAAYITRAGRYARPSERGERLAATQAGNMPAWAQADPGCFWLAADEHERKSGTTYREMEIALPRELSTAQQIDLLREFVGQEIGDRHAYQWAIHVPAAADGGEQPHAHLMFSERTLDGIERDPEQFFRRYNAKNPERGGCKKANTGLDRETRREQLKELRSRWEVACNRALEQAGKEQRIDMRSHAERGTGLEPERKQLPSQWRGQGRANVIEFRQARIELVEARAELACLIPDMRAEIINLAAERQRREQAKAERLAQEQAAQVERQAQEKSGAGQGFLVRVMMARQAEWQRQAEREEQQEAWEREDRKLLFWDDDEAWPEVVETPAQEKAEQARLAQEQAERKRARSAAIDYVRRANPDRTRKADTVRAEFEGQPYEARRAYNAAGEDVERWRKSVSGRKGEEARTLENMRSTESALAAAERGHNDASRKLKEWREAHPVRAAIGGGGDLARAAAEAAGELKRCQQQARSAQARHTAAVDAVQEAMAGLGTAQQRREALRALGGELSEVKRLVPLGEAAIIEIDRRAQREAAEQARQAQEAAEQARERARINQERQRRINELMRTTRIAVGAAATFENHARVAIRQAGGAHAVDWPKIERAAIIEAVRDNGQQPADALAAILKDSPGTVEPERQEDVRAMVAQLVRRGLAPARSRGMDYDNGPR